MEPLFELIKSLTKNEKGYIKKLSSFHQKGGKNKYILLFDAIERQREYNEAALIKKLAYTSESSAFAVAKNYLYNFILDGLTAYHGSSVKQEMRRMLDRVEVLHRKGLSDQCKKILARAKKTATRYDLHENLEEVLDWELLLAREREINEATLKKIDSVYNEWFLLESMKTKAMQLRRASDKLVATTVLRGFVRNKKDMEPFDAVFNEVNKFSEDEFSDPYSLFFFYRCQYLYRHISDELEEMYKYLIKTQELLWKHEHFFEVRPHVFLASISNKIICEIALRKFREALSTLGVLEDLVKRTKNVGLDTQFHFLSKKFFVMTTVGNFEEADTVAQEIEELIGNNPPTQFSTIDLLHFRNMAVTLYMTLGNWKRANRFTQDLLQMSGEMRPDLIAWAYIKSLIIHFEQGDQELLEYRIKSTYRMLLKKQKLYKVEALIMDFIRTKIKAIPSKAQQTEAFSQLHDHLLAAIEYDKFEKGALGNFDLVGWLESKVTRKSFLEVRKRRCQEFLN
ncbi:MAG: hypothetical protein FD123_1465 [Bacteroidetes bacterium]|nr:MAG: hypothetical protein FD123_1465 [Bacteroidota bacterium]